MNPVPSASASAAPSPRAGLPAAVWIASLAVLMAQFPINLVGVSLPVMARQSGFEAHQLQWVQSMFSLAMAASVMSAGAIAERAGRRRIMLTGLGMMAGASAVAAASATLGTGAFAVLLAAQAVSGLGAGMLLPTTLSTVTTAVSPARRGPAVALWGAGTTAGLAVGAFAAGAITTALPWGWVYLLAALVAATIAVAVHTVLPEAPTSPVRLDVPGQVLAALATVAVIVGAVEGGTSGWGSSAALVSFALFAVLLAAFLVRELRTPAPLMDPRIFRNPRFSAAALAAGVALYAVVGTGFLVALYSGSQLRLAPLELAVVIATTPGVGLLAAPFVGALMKRLHATTVLVLALLVAAVGVGAVSGIGVLSPGVGLPHLLWRLAIFGVSVSLMLTSVATVAVNAVPAREIPMAGATNTTVRQVGGALGPAVTGSLYLGAIGAGGPGTAFTLTLGTTVVALLVAAGVTVIANLFPHAGQG